MFIVIDGIDGSGKETQVKLLEEQLLSLGKKVLVLDYPRYDKESSYFARKYLNGGYKDLSAKQEQLLFAVDRFDDYEDYKYDIEKFDYIIANRYISSGMFHGGCKTNNKAELDEYINWLEDLEYNILGIPKADKTFFLNLSLEKSLELIEKRGRKKDINESNINHLKKASELAKILVKEKSWIKIDCEENGELRNREEINKDILNHIT